MFDSLKGLITWVISGGGAGAIAYVIIDRLPWEIPDPRWKRLVAYAITAALAVLAYCLAVSCDYRPLCATWVCWLEEIVQVLALAFSVSQGIHGARDLARKEEPGF